MEPDFEITSWQSPFPIRRVIGSRVDDGYRALADQQEALLRAFRTVNNQQRKLTLGELFIGSESFSRYFYPNTEDDVLTVGVV